MTILSRTLIAALGILAMPWPVAPAHAVTIASPLIMTNAVSPMTETVQYRRGWRDGDPAVGLGIAGALIGGAIIGAMRQPYGYYGPGYYRPGYYRPGYYGYRPGYYGPTYLVPAPFVGGNAVSYCAQRFKSYDPYSGTYLGYDGFRHPCP